MQGESANRGGVGRLKEEINATSPVFIMVPSELHSCYTVARECYPHTTRHCDNMMQNSPFRFNIRL
jgi:hypothetical protein